MWKEITLNASSDETQYRVWDYPIKEQYGHILLAIERAGTLPNDSVGFQKVGMESLPDFVWLGHDGRGGNNWPKKCTPKLIFISKN